MEYPQFNHTVPNEIQSKLRKLLDKNLSTLETSALDDPITLTEGLENRLQHFWSPIQHLHAVKSTPELRKAYQDCLPLLSDYETTLSHHRKLYEAYLNAPQNRITELTLRDFTLAGVNLPPDKKSRYAAIEKELSELSAKYGEAVLEATQAWKYQATDEELAGIPSALLPKDNIITLDYPCYSTIQKYAENRALREKCYQAYVTRAPQNEERIQKIRELRQELAELLGFKNYVELSLATKMAKTPEEVLKFLNDLVSDAKPMAQKELQELTTFAGFELQPWDITFYGEQLRKKYYDLDEEMLRPYFPADHVLEQLFKVVHKVFGLEIRELNTLETWHPDVKVFEIKNTNAVFYVDLYVRENKREGAWMDDYCSRYRKPDGTLQTPVAFLTCNFMPPKEGKPALLTHDDVITIFHEFGHGLHHMLTHIERIDIAGINNVPWDAVELPSQFMENFCWDTTVLKKISKHYQTGESLPDALITKMLAAKNFHAGLQLIRQLEFGLFDIELHLSPKPALDVMQAVRKKTSVIKPPDYNRFYHTFSHIFDGGYGAGYYSYLWAEVLSADAFSLFEENGVFDQKTGQDYVNKLLSQGGSQPIDILFKNFRGRGPDRTAFLRGWGLIA